MTQADSVLSTPPTNTSANNPPDEPDRPQNRTVAAPRATPSPQERADELLMRWRLARAAGIPAADRLDRGGRT